MPPPVSLGAAVVTNGGFVGAVKDVLFAKGGFQVDCHMALLQKNKKGRGLRPRPWGGANRGPDNCSVGGRQVQFRGCQRLGRLHRGWRGVNLAIGRIRRQQRNRAGEDRARLGGTRDVQQGYGGERRAPATGHGVLLLAMRPPRSGGAVGVVPTAPPTSMRRPPMRWKATKPTCPFSVKAESVMRNIVEIHDATDLVLLERAEQDALGVGRHRRDVVVDDDGATHQAIGAPPGGPTS